MQLYRLLVTLAGSKSGELELQLVVTTTVYPVFERPSLLKDITSYRPIVYVAGHRIPPPRVP